MFERYSDHARKAIYFSVYEAKRRKATQIETEHILLGILLKHGTRLDQLFPLRQHLPAFEERVGPAVQEFDKKVDLPLSNPSKRVLAYAAEESEITGQANAIGPEHLMLGILRERKYAAAGWLADVGVSLQDARVKISGKSAGEVQKAASRLRRRQLARLARSQTIRFILALVIAASVLYVVLQIVNR